jgi:ferredoxin
VADNPMGAHSARLADFLAPTGVVEASEGCFRDVAESSVLVPLRSRFTREVPVSSVVNEVDVILDLPVFKTHALTIMTGAVKNLFGVIPGLRKAHLHSVVKNGDEFAELLVDIYQALPVPVLNVMDALRGMDGQNGPSGGRVLRLGRILSARNSVAMDSVMAMMAGARPDAVPTNRIAAARGLGPARAEDIHIVGDFAPIPGFRLPSAWLAGSITGIAGATFYRLIQRRPELDRELCTRCRRCADNCPAQAISMTPDPHIDSRKCITCYCCVEACPERAMKVPSVSRGLLRRLAGR